MIIHHHHFGVNRAANLFVGVAHRVHRSGGWRAEGGVEAEGEQLDWRGVEGRAEGHGGAGWRVEGG